MARALWKGAISFGLVTIPVSLYTAKDARDNISFHMLHRDDLRRVHYKRVDDEGHEIPMEDIVKGYEYERDRYVVLEPSELEKAAVDATQSIDIMQFVDAKEIDIAYYDTPYYTEPAKSGRRAYALLRETIRHTGRVGVAKIVIRERQHLCALIADGPVMIAYTLRWPYQLRDPSDLDLPGEDLNELAITSQELKMAEQLVDTMAGEWQPEEYKDTYRDEVMRLIDEKIKTGKITAKRQPREKGGAEVIDIMALLRQSIESKKEEPKKPAARPGRRRSAGGSG